MTTLKHYYQIVARQVPVLNCDWLHLTVDSHWLPLISLDPDSPTHAITESGNEQVETVPNCSEPC